MQSSRQVSNVLRNSRALGKRCKDSDPKVLEQYKLRCPMKNGSGFPSKRYKKPRQLTTVQIIRRNFSFITSLGIKPGKVWLFSLKA
mmetsp:Transcript_22201/g.28379  ORF Transcript_22201/g.28379 Transcript_22201/m.28379 type:complete len:86 (+) Transcript_22201:2002-2259(+)